MTSLLAAAQLLTESTTSTTHVASDFPNPDPIEPQAFKDFFHKGVVLWWVLVVVGVLGLAAVIVERPVSSHVRGYVLVGGVGATVVGTVLLLLSY